MRVAVLEILAPPEHRLSHLSYHLILTKQFASVMPQAVSAWCRQLGHEVCYATYYGIGDPLRLIPSDADFVFLSCYTQVTPLAYALAKILRRGGITTVLGGPHAKAFPRDAARFFDYVVEECDRDLVISLLKREHTPNSIVSSEKTPTELPLVEERLPEICRASLFFGRARSPTTTIALLASLGCPSVRAEVKQYQKILRELETDAELRSFHEGAHRRLPIFYRAEYARRFGRYANLLDEDERRPVLEEFGTALR